MKSKRKLLEISRLICFYYDMCSLVQSETLTSDFFIKKIWNFCNNNKIFLNVCNLYKIEVSNTLDLFVLYSFCASSQGVFCYKLGVSLVFLTSILLNFVFDKSKQFKNIYYVYLIYFIQKKNN